MVVMVWGDVGSDGCVSLLVVVLGWCLEMMMDVDSNVMVVVSGVGNEWVLVVGGGNFVGNSVNVEIMVILGVRGLSFGW